MIVMKHMMLTFLRAVRVWRNSRVPRLHPLLSYGESKKKINDTITSQDDITMLLS